MTVPCFIRLENEDSIHLVKDMPLLSVSMPLGTLEGRCLFQFVLNSSLTNETNYFRLIGLCLLQNELFPLFLNRHVLKYILARQIRFHDLAFFDPVVYESLRQLIKDAQSKNGASVMESLVLYFM